MRSKTRTLACVGASVTEELQRQPLLWPGKEDKRRGWTGPWLIPRYHCHSLPAWMGAAQHCKYQQLCSCLDTDKKATSKAWSFLPRGAAGASRVTFISGVERIFLLAVVIPLVRIELPHGGFSAGWKVCDWHINLLHFSSSSSVPVKVLVDFLGKFNGSKMQLLHFKWHICSWHPLEVEKHAC